jgi:predicted ATPase
VTDGNTFHVIELLKTLFAQGLLTIVPETGEWVAAGATSAGGDGALPMPPTVRDAIAERFAGLPYELRDLLATAAVAGRGIRTDLLSVVHGMSRLRAAALADALVERHLLAEADGGYRCAHPAIAVVVRDQLTPARRREVHRAIALSLQAVAAPGDNRELAGEIARHAERGGERALACRYALVASEAAAGRCAFEKALSWLDLASSVAEPGVEADTVKRSTADLCKRAGWAEPPTLPRCPATPARGLVRGNLDLPVPEWTEPVQAVGSRVVREPS